MDMGEDKHKFIPTSDESLREGQLGVHGVATTIRSLLESCSQSCQNVTSMLLGAGIPDDSTLDQKSGLAGLKFTDVLEQRLLFWGETIFHHTDTALPLSFDTQFAIGVLTELGVVLRHQKPVKLPKKLISLVNSLYNQLPKIWRDSTEWALTATLMKTTAPTIISEGIQLSSDHDLFLASLGSSKIEKNFIMMLQLMDESVLNTLPFALLPSRNLIPSGSYDGIGVYSQISDKDGPPTGRFISVRTEWTMDQAMTDLEDMVYIRTKYERRLLLPKPVEMRVLALAGYSENPTTGLVQLLYHFPHWASQDSVPVSLRRLIAEKQLPDDIKVRFSIARKLVCAILYFHACQWIHGNIDDRNIIFFEDSEHKLNFDEPFFCKFIPSFKGSELEAVTKAKKSVDSMFGNDVHLRNADTNNLWRTVLLALFGRETVDTKSLRDSPPGCSGANLELKKWAEIDQYVSNWSKDGDMGLSTLEGNRGSNSYHISGQGLYWKVMRALDNYLSRFTNLKGHVIQRSYKGMWQEIPNLGLEGYKQMRSLEMVEPGEVMEGPDTQDITTSSTSDTNIDLPKDPEKKDTLDKEPVISVEKQIFPVKATPAQIRKWRKVILPGLEDVLEEHLPATESVSIDLVGIGTSRDESRPTIVVTCKSSRKVKTLLKEFVYDKTVFGLKVRKGSVQRSSGRGEANQGSRHQEKPLPGASIGACRGGNHLPAATYGGLILVNEKPYGLTVHHLLDPEEEIQEKYPASPDHSDYDNHHTAAGEGTAVQECQLTGVSRSRTYVEVSCRDSESEGESSGSDVGGDGSSVCELDDERSNDIDIEDDDISETEAAGYIEAVGDVGVVGGKHAIGDKPGLKKNHGSDIVVIQPAEMDLLEEEKSECESITGKYKLGTILASSGIRRILFESERHEIDWALIQISADRLGQRNVIQGSGGIFTPHGLDSEPCSVVPMNDFSNLKVHGRGRTSGLQEGMISEAISSLRIHGRETFSRSWHVTGEIGVGGDSGAWVVDNSRGGVCGHIIAAHSNAQGQLVAYINPMELLLRDIKETLQAESVCLPTASAAAQVRYIVESRLTECRGSSVDMRPISPTLSAGGSDDIYSLASFTL